MPKNVPTVYIIVEDEALGDSLSVLIDSSKMIPMLFRSLEKFLMAYDDSQTACLLLNSYLKDANGLNIIEALRADRIEIPIIYMTSDASGMLASRAAKAGATLLEKPFVPEILFATIERLLANPPPTSV